MRLELGFQLYRYCEETTVAVRKEKSPYAPKVKIMGGNRELTRNWRRWDRTTGVGGESWSESGPERDRGGVEKKNTGGGTWKDRHNKSEVIHTMGVGRRKKRACRAKL